MCSIGEDDFGDEGGLHAMIKDNDSTVPNNVTEMSDLDEKEITFEEIGLSTDALKLEKIKKIVKLNFQIKRLPKQKDAFKGDKNLSKIGSNSNKPSTSKNSVGYNNNPVEQSNEKTKSELIPKLCNGATCPTTDQIISAIEELRDLVKKSCNETRDIRKDLLGIKDAMIADNPSYVPFMRGPCQTLDDFNLLEYRVQEDEISRNALEKLLGKISDQSLERYVRCCLKAIISDKVAVQCTWHAKKDNVSVSVHDMVIMRVICDCTRNKFPTASTSLIVKIMKKWFQYSKDRWRRSMEAKKLKFDAKEVLHHLT